VEAAAYSVHSPIYTGNNKVLEREGDDKLRGNFHQRMMDMLKTSGFQVRVRVRVRVMMLMGRVGRSRRERGG